jgi:hypothetical protein
LVERLVWDQEVASSNPASSTIYTYMKTKKKEEMYTVNIKFPKDCTYEERESLIKRAIFKENAKYEKLPFRFIITDKDMKTARVNIFVKKIK